MTTPCCHLDHDRDGNCPRHPAPVQATRHRAVDDAPGTHRAPTGAEVRARIAREVEHLKAKR